MRSFSLPLPLCSLASSPCWWYASSAAIIWQAAAAATQADRRLDDGSWPRHGHQYSRAERGGKFLCSPHGQRRALRC